jgi:uncharacterized protein YegL
MSLLDAHKPVPARTLPVILILDTSGSMREEDKIDVLNDAVTEMIEELAEVDAGHGFLTMTIITFGGADARIALGPSPVADIEFTSLEARGRTPIGAAFKLARELVEDHEALPSRAYRPTLALVSDGLPTDESWEAELDALLESERGKKASRFAVAVGSDADRALLAKFTGGKVHEASEATEIRNFLRFVTTTITAATLSIFDPSFAAELDEGETMLRLQDDDAF